jgi:hypothetical protein
MSVQSAVATLLEPIPEIWTAARLLREAVDAHLPGETHRAEAVPTQNSESQRNPGVSPAFRVLSRDSKCLRRLYPSPYVLRNFFARRGPKLALAC